jgi:hypothetical protein
MLLILLVFYALIVVDFVALYMLYYTKLEVKPGFAFTHKEDRDKATTAVLVFTGIILASYYIWWVLAFVNNIRLIRKQDQT